MESQFANTFDHWKHRKLPDLNFDGPSSGNALELAPLVRNGLDGPSSPPSFKAPSVERIPRQRLNIKQIYSNGTTSTNATTQATSLTSTFAGDLAHGKPGWWKEQMLVDRSLRSMAFLTLVCAIIMYIIIFCYLKAYVKRPNKKTTSVGRNHGAECGDLEGNNLIIHLFINIAATMILGCSNTYQQLVSAPKLNEMKWALSKWGDLRVGTNSPWNISRQRTGKLQAWLCWILLISTSIPIHFLANSVVGISFYIKPPTTITYNLTTSASDSYFGYQEPAACWAAFRAGSYVVPHDLEDDDRRFLVDATTFNLVTVSYTANCSPFLNNTSVSNATLESAGHDGLGNIVYGFGQCNTTNGILCSLQDQKPTQCRMSVRMQAAFVLGGCLLVKAIYMITLNALERHQRKNRLLTFGDTLIASVLDPGVKVQNECLLNSSAGYRLEVKHTCHKHCKNCKNPLPSITGDEIGHCQKCRKWNNINKATGLLHPNIAIKYKGSLLANLGSAAITQMVVLSIASIAMITASIIIIWNMANAASEYNYKCSSSNDPFQGPPCDASLSSYLGQKYGTWGGVSSSANLTSLPADSLSSEFQVISISNGPQVFYSLLYLLLIYNMTLIRTEQEWGEWETKRKRPRTTLVQGDMFEQSYWLQLPFKFILPLMFYSALMHWLLGEAISATEIIYSDVVHGVEHSLYLITYAAYPIFCSTLLMCGMTATCWWAFTYRREGFIPQMYGSVRTCCASTTELNDFSPKGILWGDLGEGEKFRHAGFTNGEPGKIVPGELYCGRG